MPRARFLAPWHQRELVGGEVLEGLHGEPAIYHCISRVVDRRFVFETREKEKFVALMRLYEHFCQVRVLAFCVMSNHFHILLEVPSAPPERGQDWSDEQFLRHLSGLYSEREMGEIRWQLGLYREQDSGVAAAEYRAGFFARMWDLSQFMGLLKQCFSRWFNKVHDRCGTLWEERFKSVLVEDGHAARVVAAYIDLNPVRAEMVADPRDYRWCSYGEATRGKQRAREGIQRVMLKSEGAWGHERQAAEILSSWREAARGYRGVLFAYLRRDDGLQGQGRTTLTECELLDTPVRAFIDGLVIGLAPFLEQVFHWRRDRFGPRRKTGARKLAGMETDLRAMRALSG